jgi:hypothetical protein
MLRYQYLCRNVVLYLLYSTCTGYYIRIRIRISILIKTMRIQPQVLHMRENQNFFTINFTSFSVLQCFYLSLQCQRCHVFQYFGQHIDIFWNTVPVPIFIYFAFTWN